MRGLFTRIRWRLVRWTMLILVLILGLLGTAVYVSLSRSLLGEVDRNLVGNSEQVLPALLNSPSDRLSRPDRPGPLGRTGYRGGVFYLHLDPSGAILDNPQQVSIEGVTWPDASQGATPVFATVVMNGDRTRVLAVRAPDGDLLIVGQSLEPEQTALSFLLLVLVGGGAVGLVLSLAGAWFLSGRALLPIQQAFQRQQEFVADASHELRTPLTVLRAATDLLQQNRAQPLAHNAELFDDVRAEIARMQRLTQDLLTLARSDRGELELLTAPVDVAALAQDMVRRTMPLAQSRGLSMSLWSDGSPSLVEADPDRLQQVVLVLLDNAIKHTPSGGTIDVHVRNESATAIVDVVDSGVGIAAEHLPRIFDRFYRADRARSEGGTGLGLAIARMLVEAHGGHLSLTSAPGNGTRVSLTLPLVQAEEHFGSIGDRLSGLAAQIGNAPPPG